MITPGPYRLREEPPNGVHVLGIHGVSIAWFGCACTASDSGSHTITYEECLANARRYLSCTKRIRDEESIARRRLERVEYILKRQARFLTMAEKILASLRVIEGLDK